MEASSIKRKGLRMQAAIVVAFASCALPSVSQGDDSFYHSLTATHALTKSAAHIAVQISSENTDAGIAILLAEYPCLAGDVLPEEYAPGFVLFRLAQGCDYHSVAAALETDALAVRTAPIYLTAHSKGESDHFRITDEVIVAFDRFLPDDRVSAILRDHDLIVKDANPHNRNQFLCVLAEGTTTNAVDKGNEMHDLPEVRWACANFYAEAVPCTAPTDNYYPQQYYLRSIKADSALLVANPTAAGDTVAVIDDGLAPHLDIPASRIGPGWDVAGESPKKPGRDSIFAPGPGLAHGMKVTGILAASANDTGIVGVNPWCTIAPFKIFYDIGGTTSHWWKARAIDSAAHSNAKVISCSWTVNPLDTTAEIEEAIIRAVDDTTATRPYGCVIVFAAGNDTDTLRFPASLEQVIAVAALDSAGYPTSYSNYGPGMDISAVSHPQLDYCDAYLITTDQMGTYGINPGTCNFGDSADIDYTFHATGTSAACPQVAGVASLILARRPDFIRSKPEWPSDTTTAFMVKAVLYGSADDVFTAGWDYRTGYGRVNAYRALLSVVHGDMDNDGFYTFLDLGWMIDYIFAGGPPPVLQDCVADINCDSWPDVLDMDTLIDILCTGDDLPAPCFIYY
jgi:subtilisin family serine protease